MYRGAKDLFIYISNDLLLANNCNVYADVGNGRLESKSFIIINDLHSSLETVERLRKVVIFFDIQLRCVKLLENYEFAAKSW